MRVVDRDRHVGGGVLQRADSSRRTASPGLSRHPGPRASRPRPRAASTPTSTAASSCCSPTTIPVRRSARCCSTSACSAASATCTAARCCGPCELSPRAPVGELPESLAMRLVNVAGPLAARQPAHAERVALPASPAGSPSTGAAVSAASAVARRCAPVGPASSTACSTGAPAARPGWPRAARPSTRRPTSTPPPSCSPRSAPGRPRDRHEPMGQTRDGTVLFRPIGCRLITRWRSPRGRSSGSPCCSGRARRGTRRARRRRG